MSFNDDKEALAAFSLGDDFVTSLEFTFDEAFCKEFFLMRV